MIQQSELDGRTALHDQYYNPESRASFGGVDFVYRVVKNDVKFKISKQD